MKSDYEMADVLELTTPEQFKALGDPLRHRIINLLGQRALTTGELAMALKSPPSTIAHHIRVLSEAGLIKVVQTRQVRAITERYYGCTAKTYLSVSSNDRGTEPFGVRLLQQALKEVEMIAVPDEERFQNYTVSYVRISVEQAQSFAERVLQLVKEFKDAKESGEQVYGLVTALYRTNWPQLPKDGEENT